MSEALGLCRACRKRPAEFSSLTDAGFCHECAHEGGVLHTHEDLNLKSPDHFHASRFKKKIIKLHLKDYREAHP